MECVRIGHHVAMSFVKRRNAVIIPRVRFEDFIDTVRGALGRGQWSEAASILDDADAAAADDAQRALVGIYRAAMPILRGESGADLRELRENVVRRFSARHVALAAHYIVADALERRDVATAERYLTPLFDAMSTLDDPWLLLASCDLRATVHSMRGDHLSAIESGRIALEELDRYDGPNAAVMRATLTHNLAYNCLAANELEDALRYASDALPVAEELGRRDFLGQVLLTIAFAHLCLAQLDEAVKRAAEAARHVEGTRMERYVHYVHGEVARRRGKVAEATAHFQRLEELYPDIPGVTDMLLSMNVAPFLLPE